MTYKNNVSLVLLKCLFIFAGCVFVSGYIFVSGVFAYPEDIKLGGMKNRGPVAFPHELHMEGFECLECHHVMENGKNVMDESDLEEGNPDILCASCHQEQSKVERREAFHHQCVGCHDQYNFTPEEKGPTLCGECHIQKK